MARRALRAMQATLMPLALLLGCSDRPTPKPAVDADPPAPIACQSDVDCVDGWSPQMPSCGPLERCFAERCITPPAMTGEANDETGQLAFETAAGERRYAVEIVDARFEITRGLMCRRAMQRDWGMLFLMEQTRVQSFWMMNTLMPLDMVFIDEDWTVVGVVANATPRTTSPRTVGKPSRFVLELVGGEAARAGITAGVSARFYAPRNAR